MKKFLFLLAFALTCQKVHGEGFNEIKIYRCENSEVICYMSSYRAAPLFCKFK